MQWVSETNMHWEKPCFSTELIMAEEVEGDNTLQINTSREGRRGATHVSSIFSRLSASSRQVQPPRQGVDGPAGTDTLQAPLRDVRVVVCICGWHHVSSALDGTCGI